MIAGLLLVLKPKGSTEEIAIPAYALIGGAFGGFALMAVPPVFSQRTLFVPMMLLIICIGYLFGKLHLGAHSRIYTTFSLFVACCTVVSLGWFFFSDYQPYLRMRQGRDAYVAAQRAAGKADLIVTEIVPNSQYNPAYGLYDIGSDRSFWTNAGAAKDYGVASIVGTSTVIPATLGGVTRETVW